MSASCVPGPKERLRFCCRSSDPALNLRSRTVSSFRLEAAAGQEETLDRMADARSYNDWLLRRASPYFGARVLDFGAGIGTFTELISHVASVVAIEPDPTFAASLRSRFDDGQPVHVVQGGVD